MTCYDLWKLVSEGLNIGLNKFVYVEWIKRLLRKLTAVNEINSVKNNTPLLEAVIV
jgi:hypothetical protein